MEARSEIGNHVVPMYVGCGSMPDAEDAFARLRHRSHYSWTSLIHGYVDRGECHRALAMFDRMQREMVCPTRHTFLAMLRACVSLRCIGYGFAVHAHIAAEGFEEDLFVGAKLVDMYAKCGSLREARDVFDRLPIQNTVAWTSIIVGYVDNGFAEEALKCMDQMKAEGVVLDAVAYLCGLKACGSLGLLRRGYSLHAEIVGEELDGARYPFISNMLVDMYLKCGMLMEAREVFDRLECKDVVMWSTLISGYVDHGLGDAALECIARMREADVVPNAYTFNCGLKACCIAPESLGSGRGLHEEIAKEGYEGDVFVGSALVDMYAKYGSISEAFDVFDGLAAKDVVSWTALISGCVENGFDEVALDLFQQMLRSDGKEEEEEQQQGIHPDAGAYACCLRACANLGDIGMGLKLHADIVVDAAEENGIVGSALVDMYAKIHRLEEAQEVFDGLRMRNVVTWTALMAGYLDHGLPNEALRLYKRMIEAEDGIVPDAITFACGLKASASSKHHPREGQGIHMQVTKRGLEKESPVGSSLVDLYAKCGLLRDTEHVFDKLPERDVVSWTALMAGYTEQRRGDKVHECFRQMCSDGIVPDLHSWNTVIAAGCGESGDEETGVFAVYEQMLERGSLPNYMTFVSLLKACASRVSLQMGKRIHAGVGASAKTVLFLANALMEMYSRCGEVKDATMVFETMMAGCGRTGDIGLGLSMLARMAEEGLEPGTITFVNVLTLCSHAGLVDAGLRFFEAMIDAHGIAPELSHYNCVVDLLGRAGRLNDLFEVVESRLFEPDIVTWSSTLSACHQWGDAELGDRALRCIGSEPSRRRSIGQGSNEEIDPSGSGGSERSSTPSMRDSKHRTRCQATMQLPALKERGILRRASDCFHFWGD
jgi:pentatricopeptide repeat protein